MTTQRRANTTAKAFAGAALVGAALMSPSIATAQEAVPADNCAPNPSAPEIAAATKQLNDEHHTDRGGWTYAGGSTFSPCADLSYALTK